MLRSFKIFLAIGIACSSLNFATVDSSGLSFNGFKQYRLIALSSEATSEIQSLFREFPPEPNPNSGLTFLTMPGHKFESVDLLVPPAVEPAFLARVRSTRALRVHLVHRNYGRLIAQFNRQNRNSRIHSARRRQRREADDSPQQQQRDSLTLSHDFYRSFREIREGLDQLNSKCNRIMPGTCQLTSIGKTFHGNDLIVLRISKKSSAGNKTKVWLDGGIHAREWISHATVLHLADQLISDLAENTSQAADILDNHDIMMLPMYNPDGYEYSRIQNRMWRKNREPTTHRSCRGVDLNRNYGYRWGGAASVGFPCAIDYRGGGAFSALETSAVKRFVESEKTGLVLFLSFHSYGQYFLIPYGYQKQTYSTTHNEKMRCAAQLAIFSMFSVNNRIYTYGTGSDLLYEANGCSDDWAHGSAKIPYSFTIELPDDNDYGFLLPASFVPEVGRETMAGLRALLEAVRRLESGDQTMQQLCRIGNR